MKEIEKKRLGIALYFAGFLLLLIWGVFALTHYFTDELPGIKPRAAEGLWGLLTSPALHGSWSHIFSNTLPLFFLSTLLLYSYRGIAFSVLLVIWLLTGTFTWLIGEPGTNHIGASGIIYGMASFLFFSGLLRWEKRLLFISALIIFLYGSMLWGVLPSEPGVSWEGHLSGALAGVICAYVFRKKGPAPEPEEVLPDEEHPENDFASRQNQRDMDLPTDPHYHKNTHHQ